jgi:hypothetical protein
MQERRGNRRSDGKTAKKKGKRKKEKGTSIWVVKTCRGTDDAGNNALGENETE